MAGNKKTLLERQDVLISVARFSKEGLHDNDIAHLVGVAPLTLGRWKEQGRADIALGKKNSKYARLYYAIENNRSEHFRAVIGDLKNQSKSGNDRASKILLEQSPNYRHDQKINITITQEKLRELTVEELRALRDGKTPAALLGDGGA